MRVMCFAGREHHVKRLGGIVEKLGANGHETFYCCADNSLNIDVTSAQLIPLGLPFKHALDYFDPQFLSSVNVVVGQALQSLQPTSFEEDLYSFLDPFWIVSSIREFSEDLFGFAKMFQTEKPDCVLILHESNAYGRLIAYICSELGIQCIAFQEGLLRHRDQQTQNKQSNAADYSSKLCVWSEGAKKAYLEAGIPEEKLFVTGMSHLDPFIEKWKTADKKVFKYLFGFNPNSSLVTFGMPLLGRFEGDPNTNITQLSAWATQNMMQVAIRPHPFESPDTISTLERGLKQYHPYVKLVTDGETTDLLACSDLVLTQHSTVAVEAIAMGTPVAEISLSNVPILESLYEQGVAFRILSGELDNIHQILNGKLTLSKEKVLAWSNENLGPLDGKSTERVVSFIQPQ